MIFIVVFACVGGFEKTRLVVDDRVWEKKEEKGIFVINPFPNLAQLDSDSVSFASFVIGEASASMWFGMDAKPLPADDPERKIYHVLEFVLLASIESQAITCNLTLNCDINVCIAVFHSSFAFLRSRGMH